MKVLCINGVKKGEWIEVPRGTTRWKVPLPASVSLFHEEEDFPTIRIDSEEYEVYSHETAFFGVKTEVNIGISLAHGDREEWGHLITEAVFQRDIVTHGKKTWRRR